jgi:hypothetical protein
VKEMGYNLSIDETLKEYLIEKGYDESYIQSLSQKLLQKTKA